MFDPKNIEAFAEALVGVDVRGCGDAELTDVAVALSALADAVAVTRAGVLAELDVRGVTDRDHGMKTVSWVARQSGGARGPVRRDLRTGRSLRYDFTLIDAAVRDGRLTFDHARALYNVDNPRVTDVLVGAQDELITLAATCTFEQWKRDLAALVAYADTDGAEPDPYADNALHISKTLDGTVEVRGTFDAARGAALRTAVDAKADELFRRFTRDREQTPDLEIPDRSTLRALALAELVRTAVGAEPGSGTAPRAEITLIVHDHEATDAEGTPLPGAAADVWGCDPDIWAVMVDHMGLPIDVGHASRLATVAQRRAIAIRDGGCTFPGCDAPIAWCDHHHVHDWHHGGRTDLDNLVALCRHHHGVTHRTGWTMTLDDDQVPHWITPSGNHLVGQRHHRRCPDTPESPDRARHRRRHRRTRRAPLDRDTSAASIRRRMQLLETMRLTLRC